MTEDSFSKWAIKMQLLIPPSKKHRPADDDKVQDKKEEDALLSNDARKRLHRRGVYLGYPPSPLHHQLPSPPLSPVPDDTPKDPSQCWSLFCSTHEKLRRNKIPLSEIVHLRRMLTLLKEQSNGQWTESALSHQPHARYHNSTMMVYPPTPAFYPPSALHPQSRYGDDDDVPLVSLMHSNKQPTTFYHRQMYSPYIIQQPQHYYFRF
ncbi:hypothetical protein K501DRAFT_288846 [Backusella circina FSU 941]|nr:hypothetical protein K501DRAFT_288846 [Backusella circina FSU 941]